MLGCKGLIPYISLEQFFFTQLLSGVRESCWDSRSQWNPYHARDIFCGWQDRMQGNTGSVFPLWYLLTQKNYHVKVSFQCVAFLMLHPLEFIDINYMKLFEFPHPQFSLYNFHLWYCSIFLYFCIFPYTNYSFVFLNLLIFSHLPTVFSPCCPVK